jgi:hypothetical protein
MVAHRESAARAERFIRETCARQRIARGQLTLHADRGAAMTSKPVAVLLADLGVTKTHARPHVSNDNPFSEAQFKTLKYPEPPFIRPRPGCPPASPDLLLTELPFGGALAHQRGRCGREAKNHTLAVAVAPPGCAARVGAHRRRIMTIRCHKYPPLFYTCSRGRNPHQRDLPSHP